MSKPGSKRNARVRKDQLNGQQRGHHCGLVTMTTTRPVSEADAKAENKKKDEHKETAQNLACRTQNISDKKQPKRHARKKKKRDRKRVAKVLKARQPEWQGCM